MKTIDRFLKLYYNWYVAHEPDILIVIGALALFVIGQVI